MIIVVKVGTASILTPSGEFKEQELNNLVDQIAILQKREFHIVLVSSGAVGTGRSKKGALSKKIISPVAEKQLLASLGQHELMHIYARLFEKKGLFVSQLLLTKQDFYSKKHYQNISRLLQEILLHRKIIPIINENDSVAIEDLIFTDNDELAGIIASQLNADKLIILTNVKGVYDKAPDEPDAQFLSKIETKNIKEVSAKKSLQGRGGMLTKLKTASRLSELGITSHIASINEPDVLLQIIEGKEVGSMVIPAKKRSSVKRWLAMDVHRKDGQIYLNNCLSQKINQKQILSILPVGITSVSGEFQKKDLIEIYDDQKKRIGVGLARYDSSKLREYLGQNKKPAFIHYDHLYIEGV